jgi:hypothetical protein
MVKKENCVARLENAHGTWERLTEGVDSLEWLWTVVKRVLREQTCMSLSQKCLKTVFFWVNRAKKRADVREAGGHVCRQWEMQCRARERLEMGVNGTNC